MNPVATIIANILLCIGGLGAAWITLCVLWDARRAIREVAEELKLAGVTTICATALLYVSVPTLYVAFK